MNVSYTPEDLVRVAGRWNNPKRNYLLVDPLQAKHIPSVPSEAMTMMAELGRRAKAAAPGCKLVIGFAETATAVGAAVAKAFGPDCLYYQTTREDIGPDEAYVPFCEEHSHACAQKLSLRGLAEAVDGTDSVVFVDDELTTGKTLRDVIAKLAEAVPALSGKKLVAACMVDRIAGADRFMMYDARISMVSLVAGLQYNPSTKAAKYETASPGELPPIQQDVPPASTLGVSAGSDPRMGVTIGRYCMDCASVAAAVLNWASMRFQPGVRIRVVGTEECMYPALLAASFLEQAGYDAVCHATTRSPIGVCDKSDYPIRSSVCVRSVYEGNRTTYLYCLDPMDAAVVVTDAPYDGGLFAGLAAALPEQVQFFSMRRDV